MIKLAYILVISCSLAALHARAAINYDDDHQVSPEHMQYEAPRPFLARSYSNVESGRHANLPPHQVVDGASLVKGKPNKVSALLQYFHRKSKESVYGQNTDSARQAIKSSPDIPSEELTDYYSGKTDEEILLSLCPKWVGSSCEKIMKKAIQKRPAEVAEIILAVRTKPDYVQSNRLVWHKLYEIAVRKIEEKGYDEKLNMVIDTAATKNPYLFAASKILDRAV